MAHSFFKKYIEQHAEYAVNISGPLRNQYIALEQNEYDEMDLVQFMTLYDKVMSEMMKYQSQSYSRFERANQD